MIKPMARFRVVAFAIVAACLPIEFSGGSLIPAAACADGACCREDKSICVVGEKFYTNLYHASEPGSTTCYPINDS